MKQREKNRKRERAQAGKAFFSRGLYNRPLRKTLLARSALKRGKETGRKMTTRGPPRFTKAFGFSLYMVTAGKWASRPAQGEIAIPVVICVNAVPSFFKDPKRGVLGLKKRGLERHKTRDCVRHSVQSNHLNNRTNLGGVIIENS